MRSLPVVDRPTPRRLPDWLKRPLPAGNGNFFTHDLLRELRLETVCENARCPNRPECYARRTATFMILGNVCTRPCGFCAVARGEPELVEEDEPARLAEAAARLGLKQPAIARLESAAHEPDLRTLRLLSGRLGMEFLIHLSPIRQRPVLLSKKPPRARVFEEAELEGEGLRLAVAAG